MAIGSRALVLAVLARRRVLRRHDRWTPAQSGAQQDRALSELRQWAMRRSAFYRRFHAGRADRRLAELPVLTKAMLMEHFDEVSTRPGIRLADLERYLACPRRGSCTGSVVRVRHGGHHGPPDVGIRRARSKKS